MTNLLLSDSKVSASGQQLFIISRKGGIHLVYDNFVYRSNLRRQGRDKNVIYWECVHNRASRCRGRVKSIGDKLFVSNSNSKLINFLMCLKLYLIPLK